MHKPVHSHSHNPDPTSDGEATPASEPPTGPFSAPAESGYRPASRVSVPNPYTTKRTEVDDVDTGAEPVAQWRGVGLDEPEPRSKPALATTDTMTDNPASSERTERPSAPVAPPVPEAVEQRTAPQERPRPEPGPGVHGQAPAETHPHGSQAQRSQEASMPEQRPEADRNQGHHVPPYTGPASPDQWSSQTPPNHRPPQAPTVGRDPYAHPPQPFGGPPPQETPRQASDPQAPGQGQAPYGYQGHPGQYGYQGHPGHHEPGGPYQRPPHEGYAPHGHPQGYQGYPRVDHPGMPHYPMPQPAPYPQPMVSYQSAYPAPYQPPGYVLPGQPVIYSGQQFPSYGQPVQHVIVLAAGQQPQVISAESVATLFAERAETTTSEEVRTNKELTRSDPESEAPEPASEAGEAAEAATETPQVEESVPVTEEEPATDTAGPKASETVFETPRSTQGDLLNEALAGLAMRDLSLVDALLEMVEELETEAQDPDLLDKLFQIDNFATRMRRNGENLLVLTGHDGGESDAHDEIVPLLDVTRAATSEIKDYPRVSLGKIPQSSITGLAADDISHLLAELLDNATANSPEHSQVVISAQELNDGRLMIIVEDEGVGIPEAQLAELNGRLSREPVLDDNVPKHMGLYVAGRIARKHGLETRLEARSFRGISAYTIIPKELLRVAVPRQLGQNRISTIPSVSAPVTPTGPTSTQSINGNAGKGLGGVEQPKGGSSAVTAAGLPRRSATPHGSPLRMVRNPGALSDTPPPKREDTPPRLTGEARAEQIRDEIGDFLDGERAALEGEDLEGDKE